MRVPIWIAAAALFLASCSDTSGDTDASGENEDLASEVAALEEEVDRLKALLDDTEAKTIEVRAAADDLENEVARFAFEDWRIVTGSVAAAADDVDSAVAELEAIGSY